MPIKRIKFQKPTEEYFNQPYCIEKYGFGEYKEVAISLLKEVTSLLNEYQLDYFLISGTLLGYIRNNDFIPWDDDIDLMVSGELFERLPLIKEKYNDLHFICADHMTYVKISFKNRGYKIPDKSHGLKWDFCSNQLVQNRWPFIDLFTFNCTDENINFYNKEWNKNEFFPLKTINFLGIDAFIPFNSDYFLKSNYGDNYMTSFINDNHSHKIEEII